MRARPADVVVVGGGVIGCAVAFALARAGAAVTVLERGVPGREATWAAGGMLSPLGEASADAAFFRLAVASLDRYATFCAAAASASGIDVEHRASGKWHVAFTAEEERGLRAVCERGESFDVRWFAGRDARALEPALAEDVRAAVLVGRDHRVNNRRLGEALWKAAEAEGARIRPGQEVASLLTEPAAGGGATAAGVVLMDGTRVAAGAVVVAAGAWSGSLQGLPRPVPVVPVRGQMLAVGADPQTGAWLERVVHAPDCYLIPREDGRVVVGATAERVGFAPGPTPAGIASLLAAAVRTTPSIGDRPLLETWAGYRPGTPDGLPILGGDPDTARLCFATGHYRNGILLAPITAEIVTAVLDGRPPPVPIGAFRPERFGGPHA